MLLDRLLNYVFLADAGSTDAWVKIVDLLCEKGQGVLVEEWTYASAMNAWLPLGCVPVPIKMDSIGLLPEDLEETLSSWDAEARGRPRPHVMYLVSTGQNPTGALMSPERKKALYDICSRWDVIICTSLISPPPSTLPLLTQLTGSRRG